MVDFASAIEQGISAAASAKTEQDEINNVVKSLASDVEFASTNVVTLDLMRRSMKTANDLLNSLAFVLSGTTYQALVLKGKNSPAEMLEIAKWAQAGKGYPVKIGIASDEYNCPNREALERALLILVATSEFGEAMKNVAARSKNAVRLEGKSAPKHTGTVSKAAAKPVARAAAKPAVKAAAKPVARVAAKPAVKAAAKPVARAAAKPAAKLAVKPVAKAAAKPAAKVAAKPAASAVAKPTAKAPTKPIVGSAVNPAARASIR